MAIGERIHFFRNLRGMTQKYLGTLVGFPQKTADIRLAQYESGTRKPKAELTSQLAEALEVSPAALDVPDIDSYTGLMHTLFALEDLHGLEIDMISDEICIRQCREAVLKSPTLSENFRDWYKQAEKFRNGEITREQYDDWRYNYPRRCTFLKSKNTGSIKE